MCLDTQVEQNLQYLVNSLLNSISASHNHTTHLQEHKSWS